MSAQTKFRQDKSVRQADLSLDNSHDNYQKEAGLILTADYYTEWTTEKNFIEKPKSARPENSIKLSSGKGYQRQNMINKNKAVPIGHGDLYASTTYNEIYNMADICNFH